MKRNTKTNTLCTIISIISLISLYWLWHEGIIIYSFYTPKNQTFDIILNPICTFRTNCQENLKNSLPPCLVGDRKIVFDKKDLIKYSDITNTFSDKIWPLEITSLNKIYNFTDTKNGVIQPQTCKNNVKNKVAIIIPYRSRPEQLRLFLTYMIPMLIRQEIIFKIYIIEQFGSTTFNRARLLNAGFDIANKEHNWDCFMFHDVDLIAENDNNLYHCQENGIPKHYLRAWSKYNYLLRYPRFFGGVVQITKKVYLDSNGHSNEYWGWGGEDDDFYERVLSRSAFDTIVRPDAKIGRYKMVPHTREKSNSVSADRYELLENFDRENDGMSNLKYKIVNNQVNNLFEKVIVDINL